MPCSPDMEEETMRFLFQLDHRDGLSKLIGLNFFLLVAPNLFGKLKKSEKPPLKLSLALHLKNCAIIHYVVIPTHRSW